MKRRMIVRGRWGYSVRGLQTIASSEEEAVAKWTRFYPSCGWDVMVDSPVPGEWVRDGHLWSSGPYSHLDVFCNT